jgi:hypothetical protein
MPALCVVFSFELSTASGDPGDPEALFPIIQPTLRYSRLKNGFRAPRLFITPSLACDWQKLDLGLRITIIQSLDLTLEYAIKDIDASQDIKHNEFLSTLRLRI